MKKIKKMSTLCLSAALISSLTIQTLAAGWQQNADMNWQWEYDDGTNAKSKWVQDVDGRWYYLDENANMMTGWYRDTDGNMYYLNPNVGDPIGSMAAGWKLINNTWYFFNSLHDGSYGKVLTGWQWIDGYCYYFDTEGKMVSNTMTPDGHFVNESGTWVENGTVVYVQGKGISTKLGPGGSNNTGSTVKSGTSGGGSSGGGGGGGGGGSHSNSGSSSSNDKDDEKNNETDETISYTYIIRCFDNDTGTLLAEYKLNGKKDESVNLSYAFDGYELVPGQSITVVLTEDKMVFDLYYEENIEMPEDEYFSYVINHRDSETGEILESGSYKGKRGDTIEIEFLNIDGYEQSVDQMDSFELDKNNKVINIYYDRIADADIEYSFTIQYVDMETDDILGEKTGNVKADTSITIDFPEFAEYELCKGQEKTYHIEEDGMTIIIYYDKKEEIGVATPSEPEKEHYSYTVNCFDFESGDKIGSYTDMTDAGDTIKVDYPIEGYTICEEYSFSVDEDGMEFEVYYTKDSAIENYTFTVYQIDITTKTKIGTLVYKGGIGEEIELTGTQLDGYEQLGNPPETVKISAVTENNELSIYYKKESDYKPEQNEVTFTVEYVDANDHTNHILNDVTGTAMVGDTIPIYFYETIRLADGSLWESIEKSPRMFEVIDTDYNTFTIEYLNQEEPPVVEDDIYAYSIKYIAEDTGAILGITTGYGKAGEKVSYRNNFATSEYGIKDPSVNKLVISDDEDENDIEVIYQRTAFPGPEKNPITGKYDGNEWTALFVDEMGNQLLPSVSGFSMKNTSVIIDYPNTIELDGEIYRAKKASPYNEVQPGTLYHKIMIEYQKGESSETKLDTWKTKAQMARDEFFKMTPLTYTIIYREKNSWNDIGVMVGVGTKDAHIKIPVPDIPNYIAPSEAISGFELVQNGIVKTVNYERFASGSSHENRKTPYTVYFQDEDGNDLFENYSGYVSSESDESITHLPVYYPDTFTDVEGNIWEADEVSPKILDIDTLSFNNNENIITYHKTFENPKLDMIVTNSSDALTLFENMVSKITDAKEKKFYVIGEDYDTKTINPGTLMIKYDLGNYSNEVVDTFEIDGKTYYVSEIHISRTWQENDCEHNWEKVKVVNGSCLVNGSETLRCEKCGKEVSTIIPALGHKDLNHDSICDVCGLRAFTQILGDEIIVEFNSGALGFGTHQYRFVCIDDDYQGTGKMLYMCEEDIDSSIYGEYSFNNQVAFENSALRNFLNDAFADGLTDVKGSLQSMGGDRITILTKEEIEKYESEAENKYLFPSGTYLTKTTNGSDIILSDGTEIPVTEANNYAARPAILLDKPETTEKPTYIWKLGDVQEREINGKIYLFRCVSESYKDKTNTSKKMALFLCDEIIKADIVNDESTENIETLFFGTNNNYKYSNIKAWLDEHATDTLFDTTSVNIGVDESYSGQTQKNGFSNLNENLLKKHNMTTQYMESKLFIPSVYEAILLKDYLWKFNGSDSENPETQMNSFCSSYWLRTPEYDTDDKIYVVDLEDGTIKPKAVSDTEGNDYSDTGIRPMFSMIQND